MQIREFLVRRLAAGHAPAIHTSQLLVGSVSLSALVLTLAALLAGVLAAWRLGAALGWTSDFFAADGLLSRYQVWLAAAAAGQTSAVILNRWVARQTSAAPPAVLLEAAH